MDLEILKDFNSYTNNKWQLKSFDERQESDKPRTTEQQLFKLDANHTTEKAIDGKGSKRRRTQTTNRK